MHHSLQAFAKARDVAWWCLGILLYACQHARHGAALLFVDFEQIIGDSILGFSPENGIAFNVHLQLELRVLTRCDILGDILQNHEVHQLTDELCIMDVLACVLL